MQTPTRITTDLQVPDAPKRVKSRATLAALDVTPRALHFQEEDMKDVPFAPKKLPPLVERRHLLPNGFGKRLNFDQE